MTLQMSGTGYKQVFPTTIAKMDCDPKYLVKITGPVVDRAKLDANRVSRRPADRASAPLRGDDHAVREGAVPRGAAPSVASGAGRPIARPLAPLTSYSYYFE